MQKEVLIDLTMLKNANSGLCTVARSFAEGFAQMECDDLRFNFLVPPAFEGAYGDKVSYTVTNNWRKRLPVLLPKVDLWHSTFQSYRFLRLPKQAQHILTIHDLNFLYEKHPFKTRRYRYYMQRRIDKAAAVVAISQFVADDIQRNLKLRGKPLRVIYNSVDRLEARPASQPGFIKNTEQPFFFTIGQMREKKNFHALLDVMKQFPGVNLYICGGEQQDEYGQFVAQRIANEGIGNVFLAGAISEAEKCWMYRHCQAFLFPSRFEGFGLPIIEAMQFGKPVFVSNMTSVPEVAGGQGFVWESFDADYMANSIKQHLPEFANPERIERIKAHAYSFNLQRHTQEYLALYRELLKPSVL